MPTKMLNLKNFFQSQRLHVFYLLLEYCKKNKKPKKLLKPKYYAKPLTFSLNRVLQQKHIAFTAVA